MIRLRTALAFVAVFAVAGVAGCGDDPTAAAPDAPASVRISMAIAETGGGVVEAYDRTDRISLRFFTSDEVRLERDLPFDPSGSATSVSVNVPLRAISESFSLEVELLSEGEAIFAGGGGAELTSGASTLVEASLSPVIAGLSCSGEGLSISEYGTEVPIRGVALFATGDTIPGSQIEWASDDEEVAEVSATGVVTARGDGETRVRCLGGEFADTMNVTVFATVESMEITPPAATATLGTTVAFAATLRDSGENEITAPREIVWSSSDEAVASVDAEGVTLAAGVGVAWIRAISGLAADSAELTVVGGPTIETVGSTVNGTEIDLQGIVNPGGLVTRAWFEWGTDGTFESFQETEARTIEAGTEDVDFNDAPGEVAPGTVYYFRAVAQNAAGTVRGAILSFTTAIAPTVETLAATTGPGQAQLQGQVNPEGLAAQAWFEWGTDAALGSFQETEHQTIEATGETIDVAVQVGNLLPRTIYYFRLVAENDAGISRGQILSFATPAPPTVATLEADLADGLLLMHAMVDPEGLDTRAWFEWSEDSTLVQPFTTEVQMITGDAGEVGIDGDPGEFGTLTTYYFRVVAENDAGTSLGEILTFRVQPVPEPQTLRSAVEGLQATIYGSVDPLREDTDVWFEVDTDPEFPEATTTPVQVVPGDAIDVLISEDLAELQPGTRYYFRMWASNSGGTSAGETLFFDTQGPPSAETLEPTESDDFEILLYGLVNPHGYATEVTFEMDLTPDFPFPATITLDSLAAGYEAVTVEGQVGELMYDTLYYVRVVARNSAGEAFGNVMTFRTQLPPNASIEVGDRPRLARAAAGAPVDDPTSVGNGSSARRTWIRGDDPGVARRPDATYREAASDSLDAGSAKATYASPAGLSSLPPPAAITMNWRPSTR